MTRIKNTGITIFLLLAAVISTFTLSGCSRKNTEAAGAQQVQNTQQAPAATENGGATSDADQNNKPDNEEIKSKMQDTLNELVSAGTITEEQSEKIAAVYQSPQSKGDRPEAAPGSQAGSTQAPPQNSGSVDAGNEGPKGNQLASLVSDGTLTQEQADKVMEAMRQNMPKPQQ